MRPATRGKVAVLGSVTFIMVLGNTMLLPIFPEMRADLGLTARQLSWLVAAISFPSAIFSPLAGILADRVSRKTVIIPSLFLYGGGGAMAGTAALSAESPFTLMLIGRIIQGIGSAGPMQLTMALAGDLFSGRERTQAVGLIESSNGFGKVASPLIGAGVGLIGWYAPFFVYPVVAPMVAIAVWWVIREPQQARKINLQSYERALWHALERSYIAISLAVGFIALFLLLGTLFWLTDALQAQRQLGAVGRGVVLALPMLMISLTSLAAQPVQTRWGITKPLFIGLVLMAACTVGLPYLLPSPVLFVLLAGLGIGAGLVLPALDTLSTSLVSHDQRGAMTAIYGGTRSLGAAVAPLSITFLLDLGPVVPFWIMAVVAVILAILVLVTPKGNQGGKAKP